jgi:DNA polymerase III sliding clamp (beta) subunit (PCNA family)
MTMAQAINIAEIMGVATQSISSTIDELSKGLSDLGKVFRNMNITCRTPEGEYKNISEVFEETYDKITKEEAEQFNNDIKRLSRVQERDLIKSEAEENSQTLLRPETLEKTEISNEKGVFDFLKQNAYDHIEPIFKEDINQDHILNTLDIN